MSESSLHELQSRFAAHIRNPDEVPAPDGIEDRRMGIYRRLFFNNIRNFLGSYFPVLKRIYGSEGWAGLARDFYIEYRAQTPLFPELPREFLRYLLDTRKPRSDDPPFLRELAHYEWVRHSLAVDDNDLPSDLASAALAGGHLDKDQLLTCLPVLSPLARPLSYEYPVHQIRPDFQPTTPPENQTHLLVYRNARDMIKFMQLNAVSVMLLQKMQENGDLSGRLLLEQIAGDIKHPRPETVIESGLDLILDWISKDIVIDMIQNNRQSTT